LNKVLARPKLFETYSVKLTNAQASD